MMTRSITVKLYKIISIQRLARSFTIAQTHKRNKAKHRVTFINGLAVQPYKYKECQFVYLLINFIFHFIR